MTEGLEVIYGGKTEGSRWELVRRMNSFFEHYALITNGPICVFVYPNSETIYINPSKGSRIEKIASNINLLHKKVQQKEKEAQLIFATSDFSEILIKNNLYSVHYKSLEE